jgi:hypothetical protein
VSACTGPNCRHPEHHSAPTRASSTAVAESPTLGELVAQQKLDKDEAAIAATVARRHPQNRAGRRAAEREITRAIKQHRERTRVRKALVQLRQDVAVVVDDVVDDVRRDRARALPMPSVVPASRRRHWHLIARHKHPGWHGHCTADRDGDGWHSCERPHWHFLWRHRHTATGR